MSRGPRAPCLRGGVRRRAEQGLVQTEQGQRPWWTRWPPKAPKPDTSRQAHQHRRTEIGNPWGKTWCYTFWGTFI